MAKLPTFEELAQELAYEGKTLREWIEIIKAQHGTNLAEDGTDCISRQAATDALRKMQTYKLFSGDDMLLIDQAGAQTELMLLPPIQPDIVRCKDCKHNPKYEWFGCPMSHLSEKQRPETAWCWKAERRTDE